MSRLNEVVPWNMYIMSVTDDTSQVETSPLNIPPIPPLNIARIVVTLLVFQLDRSPPTNLGAI